MAHEIKQEGPTLELLTHHLAECPPEFLKEPLIRGLGDIHVMAVVSDLFQDLGGEALTRHQAKLLRTSHKSERNRLQLILIFCWFYHQEWFREQQPDTRMIFQLMNNGLHDLAEVTDASLFVTEPDRREELVRLGLCALNMRPAGESESQAIDRLNTLDSVERQRVIEAAKKMEERNRKIREELQRRAAEEAAAKISRE